MSLVLDLIKDKQGERHSKLQGTVLTSDKAVVRYIPNNVPQNTIPRLEECCHHHFWVLMNGTGIVLQSEASLKSWKNWGIWKQPLQSVSIIEMTCIDNSGLLTSEVSAFHLYDGITPLGHVVDHKLTERSLLHYVNISLLVVCSIMRLLCQECTLEMECAAKNEILHAFICPLLQRIRKSLW